MPLYEVTLYDDEDRVIYGMAVDAADPNCALDMLYDLYLTDEIADGLGVEDIALSTVRLVPVNGLAGG